MEPTNEVQPLRLEHAFERQDEQFARAFALVEQGIADRVTPGASLGVTSHGHLVAWKAFGRFRYQDDAPAVRPETIFDLASVTKAVATTTVAMLLYERGLLKVRTRVREFFREFEDGGKREITLAHLLSHSSGLPAYEKLYLRCRTREQIVGAAAAAPLVNPTGSRSVYSDIGFILLGEILARLAGQPLDTFVAREISGPLGMANARYSPPVEMRSAIPPTQDDRDFRKRIIQGEVDDENAGVMGGVAGHAGLFANAYDLALFAECLLRGGAPILQPETIRLFTRRQYSPAESSFALGWDTPSQPSQSGTLLSTKAYGHLGYTGTSLWIDPARLLSITLLTNRTWPHRESQAIKQLRPAVHDALVESL